MNAFARNPVSFGSISSVLAVVVAALASGCGDVVVVDGKPADVAGGAAGDAVADATAVDTVAADKAPTVKITSPANGAVVNIGGALHFAANVSDDRDAVNALQVKWTSDRDGVLLEGKVDASGISEFDKADLTTGIHKVKVEVTDSAGNVGKADINLLVNTAPGAPVVDVKPKKPTTLDDLEAVIVTDAVDPDRSALDLKYSYVWLRDGVATTFTDKVLKASETKKGEVWELRVKASDPKASGPEGKAQVTIGNAPPQLPVLLVQPAAVDLLSDVSCTMLQPAVDPDGDEVTYTWGWLVNGYENPGATGQASKVSNLASSSLKNASVKAGDKLQCFVIAKEPELATDKVVSPEVAVKSYDVCGDEALNPCDPAASCTNTDTLDVVCTCPKGFTGDGKACLDIDDCLAGTCDLAADCTNTVGSYQCACKPGYTGDGLKCTDVDECADGTAGCDLAADCTNTGGSFQCACKPGYFGNGKSCSDVDECALGTACALAATCENSVGGVTCTCKPGYAGDGKTCDDVDECLDNNGGCAADATCTNTAGGNSCLCKNGFSGNGKECSDIDECSLATSPCSSDAVCTNTQGSHTCKCKAGFVGNGNNCQDLDECSNDFGGCDKAGATCTNKPGTHICACKTGYSGDGKTCKDVDECATGSAGCSTKATCANSVGSFKCTCLPGYLGDGKSCSVNDLCAKNNGGCHVDANCSMVNEAAVCKCKDGYSGDGKTCANINECATGNGGCATVGGVCTDKPGTFTCGCKAGYSGDGKTCQDVNECSVSNGGCSPDAVCGNTVGGFTCTCKAGFTGDGKTCKDNDECLVNHGGCASPKGGGVCTNTPGSFKCSCSSGYAGDGKSCTEINECLANNGGCSADAVCANFPGSFSCTCKSGFTGDGKVCKDTDECAVNNGGCASVSSGGECTNKPGSFSCACKPGFQGDGKTCADIDECYSAPSWTWNFGTQGQGPWALDAPSVAGTAVKWQVTGGSLYYGNGTNFATGSTKNVGNATGPAVTMSNHPGHRLSFDLDMQTECGTTYDKLFVQLIAGTQVVTVWDKSKLLCNQGLKNYSVDVSGYAGKQVQVRFAFDTGDGAVNNQKGVFVNNLKLIGITNVCGPSTTFGCTNTVGSHTCACINHYVGDGKTCTAIGSTKETAAASCNVIYAKYGGKGMPAGIYWLEFGGQPPTQYNCDGNGYTLLVSNSFDANQAGPWSPTAITSCGSFGAILGGANIAGAGYAMNATFDKLPPHSLARVNGQFVRIDSWDNEIAFLKIEGNTVWQAPWTFANASAATPDVCGSAAYFDQKIGFSGQAGHTAATLKVQVTTSLDQGPGDEAFGIDDMQVWVK